MNTVKRTAVAALSVLWLWPLVGAMQHVLSYIADPNPFNSAPIMSMESHQVFIALVWLACVGVYWSLKMAGAAGGLAAGAWALGALVVGVNVARFFGAVILVFGDGTRPAAGAADPTVVATAAADLLAVTALWIAVPLLIWTWVLSGKNRLLARSS